MEFYLKDRVLGTGQYINIMFCFGFQNTLDIEILSDHLFKGNHQLSADFEGSLMNIPNTLIIAIFTYRWKWWVGFPFFTCLFDRLEDFNLNLVQFLALTLVLVNNSLDLSHSYDLAWIVVRSLWFCDIICVL